MNLATSFIVIAALFTFVLPARAQQTASPAMDTAVPESNRKMLRGIETVVLVVRQNDPISDVSSANKDFAVDIEMLRKNIMKKLNAAGIKTVTQTEKQSAATSSLPQLVFDVRTGEVTAENQLVKYWMMTVQLEDAVVPYRQLREGTDKKTIHVYNVVIWKSTISQGFSTGTTFDESIGNKYSKPVDDLIRDWRVANNKQVFDFPKH